MKYTSIIILFLLYSLELYSQNGVGVNTTTPTADFHLISTKEYIMKFEDRNVNNNRERILVSTDNKGTVTPIETSIFKNLIFGTLPATAPDLEITNTNFVPTTITIRLPRGRWVIKANILLDLSNHSNYVNNNNSSITVEATLGSYFVSYSPPFYSPFIEDNTEDTDDSILSDNGFGLFKGTINAPLPKGILKGDIIINNSTERFYRLYIRVFQNGTIFSGTKLSRFGRLDIKENQLFAVPLN